MHYLWDKILERFDFQSGNPRSTYYLYIKAINIFHFHIQKKNQSKFYI